MTILLRHCHALQPGDVFVLYTDGLVESRNAEGHEYGYDRLLEALRHHRHEDAADLHAAVVEDLNSFLGGQPDYDDDMKAMYEDAQAGGKRLRYVGRLDEDGNAAVGLESVGDDHAFSHIALTDNIVQFETDRYSANPLVVQGPGAGPEVTAGGVFSDLLRLAKYVSEGA